MRKLSVALLCALLPGVATAEDWRQGIFRGRPVTYQVVHGRAVFEGDILLDHLRELPGGARTESVGVAYPGYLWPKNAQGIAVVPYVIMNGAAQLGAAIAQFNASFAGVIQFNPRQSESDYVNFDFDANNPNGQCEANVGHVGGPQMVGGSAACTLATILHEMGHTVGLYHEQSRPDRDTYVAVNYDNVIKGSEANFNQLSDNFQDLGSFDYASLMEYPPYSFTRNGGLVIETVPPGMALSNQVGYSAGDIDGVKRLYGAVPVQVTVASNPPGLSVVVDGTAVTAPQSYAWALKSKHTLAVLASAQTVGGGTYAYGRWSDSTAAAHTITVAPGGGTAAAPRWAPAVTVYTANFVQLSPYTATMLPVGAGTIGTNPAPVSYAGASGQFFRARQAVTLTGSGTGGYALLTWGGTTPPWSLNPKPDIVPDGGSAYSVTGYFSKQTVTTITTVPQGMGFYVDGYFYEGPQSFAADVFGGWGAGSAHNLAGYTPVQPYSVNSRDVWQSWSDGGALSHQITVAAGGGTITGSYTPEFVPIAYAEPSCAATVTLSPFSSDGFYAQGTQVSAAAKAASGWKLTGWSGDLSGKAATQNLVVNDEKLAVANYNIVKAAFAVSALRPSSLPISSPGATVAILGRGFSASSIVFVNNSYRTSTFKNAGEIDVAITPSDLVGGYAFPIGVSNFPAGAPCSAYDARGLFVTSP